MLVLALLFSACAVSAEEAEGPALRLDGAFPGEKYATEMDEALAGAIREKWREVYANPDYRLYLLGEDDPAQLPIAGRHAFVVLGFELANGEMTEELKARCDAAAAAARAFPASILVCTGGATGANNPQGNTEAGLMKAYLTQQCGIAADRILTEERAMSTVENVLNTFPMLRERGIGEITVVTSSYHQRRAQMLFFTLAEFIRRSEGDSVALTGNYGCFAEPSALAAAQETLAASYQINGLLSFLLSGSRQIQEIAVNYGAYGREADARNRALLAEMALFNPDAAARWEKIAALWREAEGLPVHDGALPDGLPDTDELCLVVLGFQLNPDGSMKEELVERLRTALRSAEKYPRAYIVCTGGGTAAENENATEAGKMAEWLVANGVDGSRVLVEDRSLTTAQNAIYTYDLLTEKYPQVKQLAIISSDYHIATGTLLFEAEAILRAEEAGREKMHVVSNAAYRAPSGSLSSMFQAGALIELSGDVETAFEIYYETYDIHELPPLK